MSGSDGTSGPGRAGHHDARPPDDVRPPDPGTLRRGPHDRWLVALLVLAVVLLVVAVAIAWGQLRGDDGPEPSGAGGQGVVLLVTAPYLP